MAKFEITGQVIAAKNKQGIRDLRVEAWDKDVKYHDLLGCSSTDGNGGFRILFDSTYFREYAPDHYPDLFFKVYQDDTLLKNTEKTPRRNTQGDIFETIVVDLDLPDKVVRPEGKDLVTAAQVIKIADFVKASDFSGVFKQYQGRAGASLGFLSDMVINSFTKINVDQPLKPTAELRGQNVQEAKKQLESQKIRVDCVRPYNPKLNASSLKAFSVLQPDLQPGQRVHLYEEGGIVRYYNVVGEDCPPSRDNPLFVGAESTEADELKALQKALQSSKTALEKKDREIKTLQKEMKTIQKDQEAIKNILQSEAFTQFLKNASEQTPASKSTKPRRNKKPE